MGTDTSISIAVAGIDSKEQLERIITGIEMMHQLTLDHRHIENIWRDIRRVPKSRAL